jgi:hypothetical protein
MTVLMPGAEGHDLIAGTAADLEVPLNQPEVPVGPSDLDALTWLGAHFFTSDFRTTMVLRA